MNKSRSQIIDGLFLMKKDLYETIGSIKHRLRSLFNLSTCIVFSRERTDDNKLVLVCNVMSDKFSVRDNNNSCDIKFLIDKDNNQYRIIDFEYKFI